MPADFEYNYDTDRPVAVAVGEAEVTVTLADGRRIGNPLGWFPWLADATADQRARVELDAFSVYWPELDEGLDVEGMLRGIKPGYSSQAAKTG